MTNPRLETYQQDSVLFSGFAILCWAFFGCTRQFNLFRSETFLVALLSLYGWNSIRMYVYTSALISASGTRIEFLNVSLCGFHQKKHSLSLQLATCTTLTDKSVSKIITVLL